MTLLLYLLFFLSGVAALVYQVLWVRSLALVFGGSHLAVTTVLAVFMGGLALGGWAFGRRADRSPAPLALYGWLELGIAASALAVLALLRALPDLYGPLARLDETNPWWLTLLRVAFGAVALIVPTTLMGGTLPVLVRFVARGPRRLGTHLAFLYGFNTLGAVVGTLAAAFVLLPRIGVLRAYLVAVAVNLAVGVLALLMRARAGREEGSGAAPPPTAASDAGAGAAAAGARTGAPSSLQARLVLWGIGVSGFCALGYEVLWTRTLAMIVGTSVYGFAIMLVAFLTGIAVGSQAHAFLPARVRSVEGDARPAIAAFGVVEVVIGLAALGTTVALRDLPAHASSLQGWIRAGAGEFGARQTASFALAFAFMAVPAFFMGLAFPLAGGIHARRRGAVGASIGQVLAANTVGAILGSAVSGFVLLYVLGLERSILALCAVNIGLGAAVLATATVRSEAGARRAALGAGAAAVAAIAAIAIAPDAFQVWDRDYFAIFRNNQRAAFATPERIADAVANTDVLYYHQGPNEIISVIRPKGGETSLLVDGKVVASSNLEDVQCQRTLGHLPMLAHPDPKSVFVLGLGTGMTLGATALHPGVQSIVLAELERAVLPAAREFAAYNHDVLDDPRLEVVHQDGRNFLRTTRRTFDVITADPVHPWTGGAAYLYTDEYFAVARSRLSPGGVMCQWLPIYELTPEDLRAVVRTFANNFRYVALWLTYYDAELIASDAPLDFDETRLARRFEDPRIAADLAAVDMGTPREFLSYFVAGDAGVRAFAEGAVLNTDDNLWLEFSAPRSQGQVELMGENVLALGAHRESPVALGKPFGDPEAEAERQAFWHRTTAEVGPDYDRAHAALLAGRGNDPGFAAFLAELRERYPDHAPTRFLERKHRARLAGIPWAVASVTFPVADAGAAGTLEVVAVAVRVGKGRGSIMIVDPATRAMFGERYLDVPAEDLDAALAEAGERVLAEIRADHAAWLAVAVPPGATPSRDASRERIRASVGAALERLGD